MSAGLIAAVAVFMWAHSADLGNPAALAKAFDPAAMRTMFARAGEAERCQRQGIAWLSGLGEKPTACGDMDKMLAANPDNDELIANLDELAGQKVATAGTCGLSRSGRSAASRPTITRWATAICRR